MNRTKRHESFVMLPKVNACEISYDIHYSKQCESITWTADCHSHEHFFNYLHFVFCNRFTENILEFYARILIMVRMCLFIGIHANSIIMLAEKRCTPQAIIWIYVFAMISIASRNFFCPALTMLCEKMKLSESIAGATLLAFGEASPDVFTALAESESDLHVLYVELYAGNLFLFGFVAAVVFIVAPVSVHPSTIIRDMIFFLVTIIWISLSFRDKHIAWFEAIGAIILYAVYLAIIFAQYRAEKRCDNRMMHTSHRPNENTLKTELSNDPNAHLFKQFLASVNPFDAKKWNSRTMLGKILQILKAPIVLALKICIPIADTTLEMNGWSKLLNTLQIIIVSLVLAFLHHVALMKIYNVEFVWYVLVISVILAVLVFSTSRTDQNPSYHLLFSIFGTFIGSISIIRACAQELVAISSAFGLISELSDSILALSVLTWGNNSGILIASINLALNGHTEMVFTACFGSSILVGLLGGGLLFVYKLLSTDGFKALSRTGDIGPSCSLFIFLMHVFMMATFIINGFQGRRSLGIFLIIYYFTFLFVCVLSELELAHPYGSDHLKNFID